MPAGRPGQRRNKIPPHDQVVGLFDSFADGERSSRLMLSGMDPPFKKLDRRQTRPLCVWEARVSDSRIFGWCVEPGVFVGVLGVNSDKVHKAPRDAPDSYEHHARSVRRWRRGAGFQSDHIWPGDDLDAFLTPPAVPPI